MAPASRLRRLQSVSGCLSKQMDGWNPSMDELQIALAEGFEVRPLAFKGSGKSRTPKVLPTAGSHLYRLYLVCIACVRLGYFIVLGKPVKRSDSKREENEGYKPLPWEEPEVKCRG